MSSTDPYEVAWTPPARRALTRLPEKVAISAVEFIYGPLAENPHRIGHALRLELGGLHSAHRGDYRIIYHMDAERHRVDVIAVEHRSDVYRPR